MQRTAVVNTPNPVADPFQAKMLQAKSGATDFVNYAEIRRIIGMPLVFDMDDAECEVYCKNNIIAAAYEKMFRFFPVQAEAGAAFELYHGGFFPVGVGWGKTLIGLLIANKAYLSGTKKIMLLLPAQNFSEFMMVHLPMARTRIPINFPIHAVGGKSEHVRRALCSSGKKGLYVVPYSMLSTPDSVDNLNAINPTLIICDEAHNLKNRKAARTNRLFTFIEKHKPAGVCMSGTITQKSIKDYFHLIKWCLNRHCPLPLSTHLANDWAVVLDSAATQNGNQWVSETQQGPLLPLIDWARSTFPLGGPYEENIAGFRKAYDARFRTAPGVVSSGDAEIGTSLTLSNKPVKVSDKYPGYARLEELGTQVTETWTTPNGDEIDHAIHLWKWLNEIYGAGFYNELTWPEADVYAKRKGIAEALAGETITRAKEHHSYGQIYYKTLRRWLEGNSKPKLDTPFLVGSNMSTYGARDVGAELYDPWRDWKDLDFEGRPDRDSRAVRVCDFKIQACVQWATQFADKTEGCIIWYYHQAVGTWLRQELEARLPCEIMHCPAGERFNQMMIDTSNKNKIVLASMTAHGTGKNLQHFQHQYFMQWPRPAMKAEQTLGRTHRNGQLADELVVHTNITSIFDQLNFAACLNDALYIQQTTGTRQKIIYCNYDPLPKIFPNSVLVERGLRPQVLSRQMQIDMNERFGA